MAILLFPKTAVNCNKSRMFNSLDNGGDTIIFNHLFRAQLINTLDRSPLANWRQNLIVRQLLIYNELAHAVFLWVGYRL